MPEANENKLPTPPGYQSLVPFDKEAHKNLGVKTDQRFSFASSLNAIYLSAVEFNQAARHFPIVFSGNPDDVVPMVVTGLENDRNLFITEDGAWKENIYIPAYLRRYPFFTAELARGEKREEHLICVDPGGLEEGDQVLVDSKGNTTEQWPSLENFIREMEIARQKTKLFTQSLVELELLEPFQAQIHEKTGKEFRVGGMTRINQEKLGKLSCKAVKELIKNDYLFLIDMHRMSMDNFRLLLDRVNTA